MAELEVAFRRVDEDLTQPLCSRITRDRGDAEEAAHSAKLLDQPLADAKAAPRELREALGLVHLRLVMTKYTVEIRPR